MARALAELRVRVDGDARQAFLRRARDRQAALQVIGVSSWLFEEAGGEGEMVHYVEAEDPPRLETARAIIELVEGERLVLLHQLEL